MRKDRELEIHKFIDDIKSKISFSEASLIGRGAMARSMFYFTETIQNDRDANYEIFVHYRSNKNYETVGFVLKDPFIQFVDLSENPEPLDPVDIRKRDDWSTFVYTPETIIHLCDMEGKLLERITAKDLAEKHRKLTDEEVRLFIRRSHTWTPPDY